MFLKQKSGFTLIDLMVSIAIMVLLTLTAIISFVQAERNQNLNNDAEVLASQIRETENMAISGKEEPISGLVPSGGYGIYLNFDGTNIFYLFFADMNRDLLYDPVAITQAFPTSTDAEIRLRSKYSLHRDVIISEVRVNDSPVDLTTEPLSIVFKIPQAKIYINGQTNVSYISIVLKHVKTEMTRTVKIYTVSRQISVE